eukprot:5826356-Pleurochrysis_carterae.AAC.1
MRRSGYYIKILGIPYHEIMNPRIYWLELYTETKKRIAKWKTPASLSIFGRARLVNSMMIYSRFRYPARQSMHAYTKRDP